ncbi:MAG: hypothetical protein MUO19_04640 [Dehalococcoidales bacterium]|nr:hypothetical protein [Dehalococcoidales bacterium]
MNAVKGLGTAVLCFILFIALSVFGIALWVNTTVVNQNFVSRQVEQIDISELARVIVEEWVEFNLPGEVAIAEDVIYDLIYDVIDKYEPWMKKQFDRVTDDMYAYLLDEHDALYINVSLLEIKRTLKDNLWAVFSEKADTILPDIIGNDLSKFIDDNLAEYAQQIPKDLLPEGIADLPDDQFEAFLIEHLDFIEDQIETLDTESIISGLTEEIVRPFFDEFIDEFIEEIPNAYVIDRELLGEDGVEALETAKTYLGYFKAGFYGLIGLMVLLMLGVFLIHRNIKDTSRALGITLGFYGFLQVAGTIIARSLNPFNYVNEEIPAVIENLAISIYNNALMPMLWFNAAVLVVGVALIVVSFVVKPKATAGQD